MRTKTLGVLASLLLLVSCNGGSSNNSAAPSSAGSNAGGTPTPSASNQLTVFAAASTTDIMTEAGNRYEAATGVKVTFSFASSSDLARQIKAGAPADIFLSADQKWMDDVTAAGDIQPSTRINLLGNELVMIAPADKPIDVQIRREFSIPAALPEVKRIALGDPAHVPAGRYAKQALEALEWWEAVQPLLIPTQDVRAAMRLVELGEADAGIVYATDARAAAGKVIVVGRFPSEMHDPITYPVALCKDAKPGSAELLAFFTGPEASGIYTDAGFTVFTGSAAARK